MGEVPRAESLCYILPRERRSNLLQGLGRGNRPSALSGERSRTPTTFQDFQPILFLADLYFQCNLVLPVPELSEGSGVQHRLHQLFPPQVQGPAPLCLRGHSPCIHLLPTHVTVLLCSLCFCRSCLQRPPSLYVTFTGCQKGRRKEANMQPAIFGEE